MSRKFGKNRWVGLAIATLLVIFSLHLITSRSTHVRGDRCEVELRMAAFNDKSLEGIDCPHQILREANLVGARLRRANLRGTDFSGTATSLQDADLREADLMQANLVETKAIRTDFSGANLQKADFSKANLNGARFVEADLTDALFIGANLVAADFSRLKGIPAYMDRANLTDANLDFPFTGLRLCNTTMPDGNVTNGGCLSPSYEFHQSLQAKHWRNMDQAMSVMVWEASTPAGESVKPHLLTPEQIRSIPCYRLQNLEQLWRESSGDRFSFGIQRQIWESPAVNRDYNKFGEAVGWKQNGTWLKFFDLPTQENSITLPLGMFPWHQWQVQEPTPEEPTRFRREGFGAWMNHLEACGLGVTE
ncbi:MULTISPECIES: pentapeptide repeat-containing protein [unclassified Leptolyngbya]|uniref:pentapeptide repeat-containing protein n=1 Tax=unclassified Leptolyngbya TaxID=2650499 RepID=UPI001686900F|nr:MULTISPECIES: pentapeptide repeat-containing protein [unclassified Leptolyngbya]MBD1910254.1 pentapeptide repeat-containing protein [Leptolyngbya sp. FACHB-8]MBD2156423.1 pentapeptide repeat-containing protein [Leptolyngbya sp. FACHB-16]